MHDNKILISIVSTWDIPGIYRLSEYTWYIHGIYRLYTSSGFQMQAAQPLQRPALVTGRWPLLRGPRPQTRVVHGNKYTGLLNAVPMRVHRQFGQHNLNQV